MVKLVLLFGHPRDSEAFDAGFNAFLPLADRLPGLRRVVVSHAHGSPGGAARYRLMHELFFDDFPSARAAMASPEGAQAARQLWTFASENVTLFFADHLEENRPLAAA